MPNYKSFKDDLRGKKLQYSDKFLELKKEPVITTDAFGFNNYKALENVNDFKTNNYSNLFLTRKVKNSDWLKPNTKGVGENMGIVTTMSFFNSLAHHDKNPGRFLYFAKNYELFDINLKTVEYQILLNRPETLYLNYIFFIDFLDENRCRISHTFGDIVFYLAVEADKTIHFVRDIEPYERKEGVEDDGRNDNTTFIYNLDDQCLRLYKHVTSVIRDDEDEIIDERNEIYLLAIKTDGNNSQLQLLNEFNILDQDSLIYVTNNILDFDFYVNTSWVSYDRSRYIDSIDRDRSTFSLETQTLLHHQYNDDNNINFIPLKNNMTYRGNTIKGDNFSMSDKNYPDVNFRTYTNIHSGLSQEKGNDNIILTYTFHDQEYQINEGDDFFFTIPTKEETNGIDPLFPYQHINIADTKFVKNGAFSSSSPAFADKIKKLQNYNQGIEGEVNNAQYLCTWLYRANELSEPIWLDRWYYPNYISKREALSSDIKFAPSYENIIDTLYTDESINENAVEDIKKIKQNTYFDKKSDLIIEPGCKYCYQRLSRDMVNEVIDKISKKKVTEYYDQNNNIFDISQPISLNGENYIKVKYNQLHNTNEFNLNFDIYLDKNKKIGPQIFGNDYTNGFNIQNRKDLSPYLYYATDESIYMLNNKYEILHQFNLSEKYDDRIIKLVQGDTFNDIMAISPLFIYIFSYDLRLKTRISLLIEENVKEGETPTKEGKSILGLSLIVVEEDGEIKSLINYPYGNFKCDFEFSSDSKPFGEIAISLEGIKNNIQVEKTISPKRKSIDFLPHQIKTVTIPANTSEILTEQNSIIYKNNLYIPFNQTILKIILCPDVEGEFTDKERENYPAKIRKLNPSEFITNYPRLTESVSEKDTVATISGNIEVQNKIKNIFISESGKIYGLNFDKFSLAADGDTIYGLYSWDKYVQSGGGWWLFNQSLSRAESDVSTSKYAEFQSMNSIDFIRFDMIGNMALIRNFSNLADNTDPDNGKRIEIFSKAKKVINQFSLDAYDSIISLDAYNYINEAAEEKTVFALLGVRGQSVYRVVYDSKENTFNESYVGLPLNVIEKFEETVNTNAILRYGDKNILYFNLYYPNTFLYPFIGTIKWDLTNLLTGWYNINVSIDLLKGEYVVKINDITYDKITDSWFQPFVNANGTIFANTYYIGCTGKQYGTTLNEIIKNSQFDPYVCKNSQIENLSIYRKHLEYYEYQALRLENQNINTLFITLPCGIRNNIEEIVRYFRYNSPAAISNKVRINIAGTGLKTTGEFELLKKEIMSTINNNKDCLVQVEDIQFIS